MPRLASNQVPLLREHRPSGRAVVTLDGKDHYCGAWGSPQAQQEYSRLIQVWWANGRKMPREREAVTVGELADRFLAEYARAHRKRGRETSMVGRVRLLTSEMTSLFGNLPATAFGSDELRTLRSCWVDPAPGNEFRAAPVGRSTSNAYQRTVLGMFRWALRDKLVPAEVVVELQALGTLRAGEMGVRDRDAVEGVSDAAVERTIPHVRPPWLQGVIRLQRLTGMRPGEALAIRPGDIDRSGAVWVYTVAGEWYKNAHKTRRRRLVAFGPRSQELLKAALAAAPGDDWYVYRGSRSKAINRPYKVSSYRGRVYEACDRAGVPRWSVNSLRHAGLSEARAKGGLDTAQSLAGHATATMTETYARVLPQKAIEWARENG